MPHPASQMHPSNNGNYDDLARPCHCRCSAPQHPTNHWKSHTQIAAELHLHLNANANAASLQSNLGDGQPRLPLALTVSPAVCNVLSRVTFMALANPGTTSVIPAGTTIANTAIIVHQHAAGYLVLFQQHLAMDNALKQQVISCVNSTHLCTLSHCITGFANVTMCQMPTHLHATCRCLSPANMQGNDARMKTSCNPNQPIEAFIDQIEDGVALADSATATCTPAQIIAIACNSIFSTGMFPEACCKCVALLARS